MTQQINEQETDEEIIKWGEELDELDSRAFAGREVSDEEFIKIGKSLMSGTYLQEVLDIVQAEKQKVNKRMAFLEAIEVILLDKIAEQDNK